MADRNARKSLISCFLADVIREHSSREHQLTQGEIRELLLSEQKLSVDRKTIARVLNRLLDEDIAHIFRDGKTGGYYYDRTAWIPGDVD